MDEDEIHKQASDLSKKIQESLASEIEAKQLSVVEIPYVKFEVDFNYDASEIGMRTTTDFNKTLLVPKPGLIGSFEHLPEHKRLLETTKNKVEEERAINFLHTLEHTIVRKMLQGVENQTPYAEDVKKSISIWIDDLLANPLHWEVPVWIRGVRINDDIGEEAVELGHGLSIRRPNSSDFGYELPSDEQTRYAPNIDDILSNVPDAILELSLETSFRGAGADTEVENRLDSLLTCLRLYELGSIYAIKRETRPESFMQSIPIPRLASWRPSPPHKYDIGRNDINRLRRFIDTTEKWLSVARTRKNVSSKVEIAIERYGDALLAKESATYVEHSIASSVMCLEALYLPEMFELKLRLSQRVATVLRHFSFDPWKVYNVTKCAYDIRSKFVHGQMLTEREKEKYKKCGSTDIFSAQKIANSVLEYARISILTYLAIIYSTKARKKGFIDRIDRSIVDAITDETISDTATLISAMTPVHSDN